MSKRNTHILLVEDDSVNQLVACLILRQQGIEVTVANNGMEALTQICTKAFQLVLMDIQMPIMDGYEATARIRAMGDPYFKGVPIIAFTASSIVEVQYMAAQKGMNDIISKPLDVEELLLKVDKYMPATHRPLWIDFNLYTLGEPDVKRELIGLLIDNVKELQITLRNLTADSSADFLRVLHKVKFSMAVLNDREFSDGLEEIRSRITDQPHELWQRKAESLCRLCDQVIDSLVAESRITLDDFTSQSTHS